MAVDRSSEYLIARGSEGVDVWSIETAELEFRIDDGALDWGPQGQIDWRLKFEDVVFSPDNQRMAIRIYDRPAQLWDLQAGSKILDFAAVSKGAEIYGFHPSGDRLLVAFERTKLAILDTSSGRSIAQFDCQTDCPWSSFSPDGNTIAVHRVDGGADLFDAATGESVCQLSPPKGSELVRGGMFPSISFSPDGNYLVTGCGQLHVWTR